MDSDSSKVQQVPWHKVFRMYLCIHVRGAAESYLRSTSSSFLMKHFLVLSLCIFQGFSVISLCFSWRLLNELISKLNHSFEFIYLYRGHFSGADFHIKDPFALSTCWQLAGASSVKELEVVVYSWWILLMDGLHFYHHANLFVHLINFQGDWILHFQRNSGFIDR